MFSKSNYSTIFIIYISIYYFFYSLSIYNISISNNNLNKIEHQYFANNKLHNEINSIFKLRKDQKMIFFNIINHTTCPKHISHNLSYCLQKQPLCYISFYLVSWSYKKIIKLYPENIILKILSKEVYNGIKTYPHKIYVDGYYKKGNKNAKINIVEYGDLECMHCKKIAKILDLLLVKHPNNIKIIYKYFPISFHPQARILALISESFEDENHFWNFYDMINNHYKINNITTNMLKGMSINVVKIRKKTFDKYLYCKVINSVLEARKIMLQGVPSIFFNGRKFNLTPDLFSLEIRLQIEKYLITYKV